MWSLRRRSAWRRRRSAASRRRSVALRRSRRAHSGRHRSRRRWLRTSSPKATCKTSIPRSSRTCTTRASSTTPSNARSPPNFSPGSSAKCRRAWTTWPRAAPLQTASSPRPCRISRRSSTRPRASGSSSRARRPRLIARRPRRRLLPPQPPPLPPLPPKLQPTPPQTMGRKGQKRALGERRSEGAGARDLGCAPLGRLAVAQSVQASGARGVHAPCPFSDWRTSSQ
mmetsp:Transcript_17163/g.49790  ORF Transcript_17163/g.49790 Transcript_17163/m.49790 type:complete len:226 (+) Transcript_17163:689-1366(+)